MIDKAETNSWASYLLITSRWRHHVRVTRLRVGIQTASWHPYFKWHPSWNESVSKKVPLCQIWCFYTDLHYAFNFAMTIQSPGTAVSLEVCSFSSIDLQIHVVKWETGELENKC
jgi:hypothetical protein